MIASLASTVPVIALVALLLVLIVWVSLIYYALRIKGDVLAELSHGKTTLRIAARDRRYLPRSSDH